MTKTNISEIAKCYASTELCLLSDVSFKQTNIGIVARILNETSVIMYVNIYLMNPTIYEMDVFVFGLIASLHALPIHGALLPIVETCFRFQPSFQRLAVSFRVY